jgi:hypothetical protein
MNIEYIHSNQSLLYPEENAYLKIGILEEDCFLDIETKRIYPILYCDEKGLPLDNPVLGYPYVYALKSYDFKKEDNKERILKKAEETYKWYQEYKELEEKGKILSYQKYKRKYQDF